MRTLGVVLFLVLGGTASLACEGDHRLVLGSDVEITGVLKSGTSEHDAQGPFEYVYLELPRPVCVDAGTATQGEFEDEAEESVPDPVSRIQVAGELISTDMPVGRTVTAKGALFPAHTAWHAEPVLIDARSIDQTAGN
jgi:hypothetical protein